MFTPVETSVGAVLLHQATSALLFQCGSILGASGYLRRLFTAPTKETVLFFAGMALSSLPLRMFLPELVIRYPPVPTTWQAALVTAGLGALVGWGTKASNGCTSGHMLCGLSRLSGRSVVAVSTFLSTALLTHHLVHPSLRTEICPVGTPCYTPTYPSSSATAALLVLAATVILATRTIPRLVAKATEAKATDASDKPDAVSPARQVTQFLVGLEFGLGLQISQMASPSKLLAFFSFPVLETWDPSLGMVMLFGVLPNLIENKMRGFEKAPDFNCKFDLPKKTIKDIDWKFILGAAVFGVGWGLSGTCPGPAVLRAIAQPAWGLFWMTGYWAGGKLLPS
ncbi:YeeE/YedE family integral membrane protein-like protein [Lojkania enalia]|uniref:YeeE/YedE family integral membrane protein-like protein n=1 Tax=Lojkania enalia TaxID=147567 RepID=A0A9P4K7Z4_9PLEO|nr:YeeE/YedE family integral membrane protein-like protein [Didymosphaeria enalia]